MDQENQPFQLVQSACNRYRQALEAGESPSLTQFLEAAPDPSRPTLLRNLIYLDVSHRMNVGELPKASDYQEQLPDETEVVGSILFESALYLGKSSATATHASQTLPISQRPKPFSAGTLLGDYELIEALGQGGMGTVYSARHIRRGNCVALKLLPAIEAKALHYFKTEFRRISEINHPNLVRLYTLENDGGFWFFTMEQVSGTDFLKFVRPGERCLRERLQPALRQLGSALFRLHNENVIHCDLKPSNVMVDEKGRVVVLDFGLAIDSASRSQVRDDGVAGTPSYMAPEQVLNRPITAAADWYAVGVMLFHAIGGRLPVLGYSARDIMLRKTTEEAPPCITEDPELEKLAAFADALLRREPEARPSPAMIASLLSTDRSVGPSVRTESSSLLVGRDDELGRLLESFRVVTRSQTPNVIRVEGRSGEGKSALIEHFLESAVRANPQAVAITSRCYDRESVPFRGLDGVIDEITNQLRQLDEETVDELIPADIEFLARLFPVVRRIRAIDEQAKGSDIQLDSRQVRTRAFVALRNLLRRMARLFPIILVIDDLQWGDADSAEALFRIIGLEDPPPLLVLLACRSDEMESSDFLNRWDRLTSTSLLDQHSIKITPLSIEQVTEIAINNLGTDSDEVRRLAFQIASQTGGNAMLVNEMIDAYDANVESVHVMAIDELIAKKLQRVPVASTAILELIAVTGRRWSLDEIKLAFGHSDSIVDAVTAMRSEKLVRLSGDDSSLTVDTYHDRIRETVLQRLVDDRKRELHDAVGRSIEDSIRSPSVSELKQLIGKPEELSQQIAERIYDLSYHFDQSGRSEKASIYAILAGKQASVRFSPQVAAEQFETAGRHLRRDQHELRFTVSEGRARALGLLGRYKEAEAELDESIELANGELNRARVVGLQAEIASKTGRIGEGIDRYGDAIRHLGFHVPRNVSQVFLQLTKEVLVQSFHSLLPRSLYRSNRSLDEKEALAVELFNRKSIVSYYNEGARMLWTHLRGFNLAETRAPSRQLAYAYGLHAVPILPVGLHRRGLRYSQKAAELAEDFGDMLTLGHVYAMRVLNHSSAAEFEEGIRCSEKAIEFLSSAGDTYLRYFAENYASLCHAHLGQPIQAIGLAKGCFSRVVRLGEWTGATGSLFSYCVATSGNLPFAKLRSCFQVLPDNHFHFAQIQSAEGIWHLNRERYDLATKSLETSWRLSMQYRTVLVQQIMGLAWLITSLRKQAIHCTRPNSTARKKLLNRTTHYLRRGRLWCLIFPTSRAYIYREAGLLAEQRKQIRRAIKWLRASIDFAEATGNVSDWSLSVLELHRLQRERGLAVNGEQYNSAASVLERINNEVREALSEVPLDSPFRPQESVLI